MPEQSVFGLLQVRSYFAQHRATVEARLDPFRAKTTVPFWGTNHSKTKWFVPQNGTALPEGSIRGVIQPQHAKIPTTRSAEAVPCIKGNAT